MKGQDEKFSNDDALADWLEKRGVDDAGEAAAILFAKGFNKPSTLWGISSDDLKEVGFSIPVARYICNKLMIEQKQQQVRCCCCFFMKIL